VIAHVVLYELRPDLTLEDREAFNRALEAALAVIPFIRRSCFGRRRTFGLSYERAMNTTFEFFALLEFDNAHTLQQYLEHAAHITLGTLFWSSTARTLVFDYEIPDDLTVALREWARTP
jgi:Stress responsive A/B Barrel Domain